MTIVIKKAPKKIVRDVVADQLIELPMCTSMKITRQDSGSPRVGMGTAVGYYMDEETMRAWAAAFLALADAYHEEQR